jgi:predicted O-linked N-acetylglucosamine transferase (SPINDLY family)
LLENQKGHAEMAVKLIRRAIAIDPKAAEFHANLGLILSALGRYEPAAACYREALSLTPDSADLQFHLATALSHLNRFQEAVPLYQKSLAQRPDHADCHANLAIALTGLERFEESLEAGRKAIALRPDFAEAHYNMAGAYVSLKRHEEALASYRQTLHNRPDLADAHNALGALLIDMDRPKEAEAAVRKALAIRPEFPAALNNLGNALLANHQPAEALVVYTKARQLQPDNPLVYYNAGHALKDLGRLEQSIAAFRHALALKPDDAKSANGLGMVLGTAAQHEEAVAAFRRAIEIDPKFTEAFNNLGNTLNMLNRHGEAIEILQRAMAINPNLASIHNSMAIVMINMGRLDEGIESFRRAVELDPRDSLVQCNLVFCAHYLHGDKGALTLAEAQRWDSRHAEPLRKEIAPHANSRDPNRRLRIGYVSNDFRDHSVSRFLQPLLQNHDHRNFEIICYSDVRHPDPTTTLLRGCADQWHEVMNMTDESLVETIRGHGIDILIDLMGFTSRNRMLAFARKPAPIQISYLGHPGTTGLATMDYRLTDSLSDPLGMTEEFYSETLLRLPRTNWCFTPPPNVPEVVPPPVSRGQPLCFGSFNKYAKATPQVLDLWAEILKTVKGSRLFLKDRAMADPATRERTYGEFERRGIERERLQVGAFDLDLPSHFGMYGQVDIALDPFPYNGTTTTCEALWMGVPVVTLAGVTHIARVGVSLLTNVGLPELIASSPEQYSSIAVNLAESRPRLENLRRKLRDQMRSSPLMDGPRFARDVEAAYRDIWRRWCATP